ncbi:uncharacterized protein LOC106159370 [Lingula anatina]|uniref:Uncharacterized protein LOC106159370 n=1 Tax=Lingula anatina TaxID=7574 RepID=A0A1S3HYJ7_LINAN|nr:uncharacterized protein LOC106159370 [Lingula anatina]|eukprot:XP_013391095.1 uncharacterized protein LOC106159370 [Lingula anatina]
MVGKGPVLGDWNPQKGKHLERTLQEPANNRMSFLAPKHSVLEFKLVRPVNPYCHEPYKNMVWEPKPYINRIIKVTSLDGMMIKCSWGTQDMEIKEWNVNPTPSVYTMLGKTPHISVGGEDKKEMDGSRLVLYSLLF